MMFPSSRLYLSKVRRVVFLKGGITVRMCLGQHFICHVCKSLLCCCAVENGRVASGGMIKSPRSAKGFPAVLLRFYWHKMASCLQEACE